MGNATSSSFSSHPAVGSKALMGSTTAQNSGVGNVAIGQNALSANTSGAENNALGANALANNTSGSQNNAIGFDVLEFNTTGSFIAGFGERTLLNNTTGSLNFAFGGSTPGNSAMVHLSQTPPVPNNTAIGFGALQANTTGSNNMSIGFGAGYNISTGYSNIMLGDNTQTTGGITTGGGNIGIGPNVFFQSATANNQLNIGNILFGALPATTTDSNCRRAAELASAPRPRLVNSQSAPTRAAPTRATTCS